MTLRGVRYALHVSSFARSYIFNLDRNRGATTRERPGPGRQCPVCGRRAAAARRGGRGPSRTAPRAAPAAPAFRRGSDPASQTFSPTATAPAATGVYDTASLTRQVWRSSSTTLPVRVAAYSTTQYYTSTVGCYATRACATPACANLLACRRGTSQHPTNDAITCTHWPRPEFPLEAPQISFINLPDSGPNLQKIRLKIPACS